MKSSHFRFPRRVRIHGGECGAVARALHHEAQKNALIPYEQVKSSLISDERASVRQAGSGKCLDSTLNERKQMSTKTSIKRIALVAVSALGFGLLSVMPANAVDSAIRLDGTPATMLRTTAGADATWTVEASGTGIVDEGDINLVIKRNSVTLATAPAGITVNWDNDNTDTNGADTNATDNTLTVEFDQGDDTASAANDALASVTLARTLAPGKYEFLFKEGTSAGVFDDAVTFTLYVSTAPTLIEWGDAGLGYQADVGGATVSTGVTLYDAQENPTYLLTGEAFDVAVTGGLSNATKPTLNTYFFDSATYGNTADTGVTITVDPASATAGNYTLTASRAAGLTGVTSASAALTVGAAPKANTSLSISSGTYVNADGNKNGTYDATGDLSTTATAAPAYVSTANNSLTFVAATNATSGSIRFTVVAAGSGRPAGISASTGTNVAIVDNGASASPRYTASLTLTATAPAAGFGYTVGVTQVDGTTVEDSWTVIYQAPVLNNVTTTDSLLDGGSIRVLRASTNSFEFLARDQFGIAIANQAITATSSGRNARNSGLVTDSAGKATFTVVDTSTSTTSLVDTVTGTIAGSTPTGAPAHDNTAPITVTYASSIDVSAVALTANEDSTADDASIAYDAAVATTGLTVVDLKTNTTALDATSTPDVYAKDQIVVRAAVTDAAGNPVQGVRVTFAGTAGVYFAAAGSASLTSTASIVPVAGATAVTTRDVYTDSDGYAFIQARFTKTGSGSVTATSFGKTSTAVSVTVKNTATDARYIATTARSGSTGASTVASFTVTDGFANPVSGVAVTFTLTGVGTFLNGTNTVSGTTDTSGIVTAALTSASAGTATVTGTVTTANSQAADEATAVTTLGFAAAIKSASSVITLAVTKSAEVLAAEAAEAEAKKATTEAAAATAAAKEAVAAAKAAQDAAVAAAQKAATDAVAAAKAAQDAAVAAAQKAATDAVAASKASQDAAVAAAKAAGDAAVAAAVKAALDAVAASKAAQDAAVAEAQAATEAAAESIDAANAATDAANIAAEAADAATVAAEEARDAADAATAAVEELATQVSTLFASLKAQLTTLANTVAKIAKKVRA